MIKYPDETDTDTKAVRDMLDAVTVEPILMVDDLIHRVRLGEFNPWVSNLLDTKLAEAKHLYSLGNQHDADSLVNWCVAYVSPAKYLKG